MAGATPPRREGGTGPRDAHCIRGSEPHEVRKRGGVAPAILTPSGAALDPLSGAALDTPSGAAPDPPLVQHWKRP